MQKRALDQFKTLQKEKSLARSLRRFVTTPLKVQRNVPAIHMGGKYKDLTEGRFRLAKVVTIERKDDVHSISNKWADFTSKIITEMMKQGEDDAWKIQI